MEETRGPVSQSVESRGEAGLLARFFGFLKRHPVMVLVMLSPGIPEYLSGSSNMAFMAFNPPVFLLFLGLNIGLYSTGVLLIREAVVRWRKGWASVFLLGFAYAILEEGLALETLFNPLAPPLGTLASYSRWIGVNWVWTVGILLFHSVFSIALPIFLFRMAFPRLRSESLLSTSGLTVCSVILGVDSLFLYGIVNYWPGWELIFLSAFSIGVFVSAARKVPANMFSASRGPPSRRPRTLGFMAGLFFPAAILTGAIAAGANLPPLVPIMLDVLFSLLILRTILHSLGSQANQDHRIALAIGLIVPVVCFGIIASLTTIPLIIIADIAFAYFIRRLWKKHHTTNIGPSLGPIVPQTAF